jgi:hypothetical protein
MSNAGNPYNDMTPWDTRLCFDVALGVDSLDEILARYALSAEQFQVWAKHPLFMRTVGEFQKHIRENGLSFRAKARMQAEDLLGVAYGLVQDKNTPASTRADLIKWIAKMGELEPTQAGAGADSAKITRDAMSKMLSSMDDGELELRVMQIVSTKRSKTPVIEGKLVE